MSETFNPSWLLGLLPGYLLVLARVSGLIIFAPFFGSTAIPLRLRLALAVVLSLALFALVSGTFSPPSDLAGFVPALLGELLVGLILGLAAALIVATLALLRIRRFQRLLAHARPAPVELADRVAELAARVGLRRAPPVLLLPARVPPMLWPGRPGPPACRVQARRTRLPPAHGRRRRGRRALLPLPAPVTRTGRDARAAARAGRARWAWSGTRWRPGRSPSLGRRSS